MSIIFSPPIFIIFLLSAPILNILSLPNSCLDNILPELKSDHREHDFPEFQQKSKIFWEFNDQSNSWVEVKLPYDLISCIDGDCTVVGSIQGPENNTSGKDHGPSRTTDGQDDPGPVRRRRVSLTRMSEASVWVTGLSGSIFERFWNGLQWVFAPHDLPVTAGHAVSVFIANQTMLALSESGQLYQLQLLTEIPQPIWAEFRPELDKGTSEEKVQISSGVLSNDNQRLYFCTKNGTLLELSAVDPPRWANHGRPPGATIAAIADGAMFKPGLVFTISGAGDLYEYDGTTKPPWKKHIRRQGSMEGGANLLPSMPCSLYGAVEPHSVSLFLLVKGGELIERRLRHRKWKWMLHGNPHGHPLSSITCISQDEPPNETTPALFATSASGLVFQYRIQKKSPPGSARSEDHVDDPWINHEHPLQARVARGVPGLQMQPGRLRLIFALDDGRLGELHLSGLGGETPGRPYAPVSTRRKSLNKYVWSVLDTPETEGWNAEYCTDERGPSNCIMGTKEEMLPSKWRRDSRTKQQSYLLPVAPDNLDEQRDFHDAGVDKLFRLRLMQERMSFFLVTKTGVTFEYLSSENAWIWLRHEHPTRMEGIVGNYNGSLFMVDENGSLLIRERSNNDLTWTNCSAMRKGRQVISGPPWDSTPGRPVTAKLEDSIFLVSRNGRLLQFTVALRKFKWKDCRNPPGVKIASIVDQERFRENVVFAVGKNGKLYQYNKVTELWHEHYQSQHLVLSRAPGTAMRPYMESLGGSVFMLSRDGGLVEYEWSTADGWNWIEHGTPHTNVTLVGAPGPCFGGNEVFLIGSGGNVYLRYLDGGEWQWMDYGFPRGETERKGEETCMEKEFKYSFKNVEGNMEEIDKNCDPKVSSTRPIAYAEDTVIFELQDGRLGEMRRMEDRTWVWTRTIGTPTSPCTANFWTSWAS